MIRTARVIVPALAHHVTKHGNRGEPVFFGSDDYRADLGLLAVYAAGAETQLTA